MMFNPRKILIITFILIFFISISAISATEDILASECSVEDNLDLNLDNSCENDVISLENNFEMYSTASDVDFTSNVTDGADSVSVLFNGTSDKEDVDSWNWDFGDGETGEGQNITHTYSKIGLYNVTLSVKNNEGTFNITKNNYISVYHIGEVFTNPSFDEGEVGFVSGITSTDYSIYNVPGWVVYADTWSIGYWIGESYNGQTRVLQLQGANSDLKHIYQIIDLTSVNTIIFKYYKSPLQPKNFIIRLNDTEIYTGSIVRNQWSTFLVDVSNYSGLYKFEIMPDKFTQADLCFDDFTVTYNDKVTSNFIYGVDLTDGINVQFTNRATGLINSIFWDFGDGTNSSEINPSHTFEPGNYKVTLTVSNENNTASYSYDLNLNYPTIDGKMYASVQDAINDAESGAVIDIPSDLSENLTINQTVTLNFNGNKLSSDDSPLISVVNGADVTVNKISLSGDNNVFAVDETSKLTIKDSTIDDAELELQSGNITVDNVNFNNSYLTVNANATLTNVNAVNSGVIVSGGKSKITKSNFTSCENAITQIAGELELSNNIIKDNVNALNITGSATISLNAIYNNTGDLNINESATVTNNWFGTNRPEGYASYLRLVLTSGVSEMYPGEEYTINVEFVANEGTLDGSINDLTLEFTTLNGDVAPVTISDNKGELKFTAGSVSEEVVLSLFDEEYIVGDASIVAKPLDTNITITSSERGVVVIKLTTAEGNVSNANVSYNLGNGVVNATTDANGEIIINALTGIVNVNATFDGNKTLNPSNSNATFDFTVSTVITAPGVSATYNVAKNLVITLKDANGNVLANQSVSVKVGTISKTLTTDAKGQASVAISSLVPKTYTATISFAGDDTYISSSASAKVVVAKAKSKITAKKKTFKAKKKTKKYTITLKAGKKAISKVKVTLKVKGKTYKAKTNAKGKAVFKIKKLTKKGKYTAKVKFAGNKYFKASTKKVKITVKK